MSDWIEWTGGENPVPGQKVDVKARSPHSGGTNLYADSLGWSRQYMDDDIIAYRLATPSPAAQDAGLMTLADALVDDLMSLSDEELLSESAEDGIDPEQVAGRCPYYHNPAAQDDPAKGLEVELNALDEIEAVISIMRKGAVRRNGKRGVIVDIEATDTTMIRAAELLTAVTQALAAQVSERQKNADRPRR